MAERPRRFTRRRVLAGSVLGGATVAGVVTGAVFATRDGRSATSPAATAPPCARPTAGASPATPTANPRPGGLFRKQSPTGFTFDTFDPQVTGQPSVIEVLGRTHSRLLNWTDFANLTLGADL